MNALLIALAIPLFFVAIAVEYWLGRHHREPIYALQDSIADLGCGVGQQVLAVFFKGLILAAYALIVSRWAVWHVDGRSVLAWVLVFLGVDLCYYWFHRASHRINLIWAGHIVHHHSEEYNLSVALRQSWFVGLVDWIFYLPLALIGVPVTMFVIAKTLNTLYQFWIHTRLVGRLGPLEWFLNTPSHHRVHHGINPTYIDKNYGGMLIIWDRLFGTFEAEDEEPVYGTVKPLASFNPLWANVHYLLDIARLSLQAQSLKEKLWALFAPPDWRPSNMAPVTIPEVQRSEQRKYAVSAPRGLAFYIIGQFALAAMATTVYLYLSGLVAPLRLGLAGLLILVTVTGFGGLFEGRRWALWLEYARLVAVVATVATYAWGSRYAGLANAVAFIASSAFAIWLSRYRPHFAPS
ncbi:MAG: sterol desaturase family protein [Myxococcales bacterium]|nr:sterol desaturase family protein [Myxococcales bacterium]